jgi:hypothetical protein
MPTWLKDYFEYCWINSSSFSSSFCPYLNFSALCWNAYSLFDSDDCSFEMNFSFALSCYTLRYSLSFKCSPFQWFCFLSVNCFPSASFVSFFRLLLFENYCFIFLYYYTSVNEIWCFTLYSTLGEFSYNLITP